MAGFAQTTINKLNQFYTQWVPRLPAELNPRNVLIFCVGVNLVWDKRVKVANLLPAIVIAVIAALLPV